MCKGWILDPVRTTQNKVEPEKFLYLKRELGVSKFSLSRYVYVLARETFLTEDLRTFFPLFRNNYFIKCIR